VSYKRDVDDIRESPALDLLTLLHERGAQLAYSDPHVPFLSGRMWQNGPDLQHVDIKHASAGSYDCVVIVTDHSTFDYDLIQRVAKVVVDTRNAIKNPGPHVIRLGGSRQALSKVTSPA